MSGAQLKGLLVAAALGALLAAGPAQAGRPCEDTPPSPDQIRRGMDLATKELNGRSFCHNDRYSLADIALGCCLGWLDFRKPGDVDWHAEYRSLAQHYAKLMERQPFADTVPQAPK